MNPATQHHARCFEQADHAPEREEAAARMLTGHIVALAKKNGVAVGKAQKCHDEAQQ